MYNHGVVAGAVNNRPVGAHTRTRLLSGPDHCRAGTMEAEAGALRCTTFVSERKRLSLLALVAHGPTDPAAELAERQYVPERQPPAGSNGPRPNGVCRRGRGVRLCWTREYSA